MVFSNTTTQGGLVQRFEFWTRNPYGSSGNTLKTITNNINGAFDEIMPLLLMLNSDHIRWDDFNHTDRPWGTLNLVSGQSDYTISEDDNALDILNLTNVRIYENATSTEYVELQRMLIDDPRTLDALSPNPSVTGVPTHFVEQGNSIFLYPNPNYSATNGIQIFFEREQSYFTSSDTTKEPGFPKPFHEILAMIGALNWILVNKPQDVSIINVLRENIARMKKQLKVMIDLRNPRHAQMTMKRINYI